VFEYHQGPSRITVQKKTMDRLQAIAIRKDFNNTPFND